MAERGRRIIVTGSRDWDDATAIGRALHDQHSSSPYGMVVVQGGADGADSLAKAWAEDAAALSLSIWVKVETFEADWARLGRAAGPVRNEAMLKAGADLVLAFPIGDSSTSPGTWNCIEQAAARGIPVRIFPKGTRRG